MHSRSFTKKMSFWILLVLFGFTSISSAQVLNHNEVEFTATVKSVLDNGNGKGTVFVLASDAELKVLVDAETDLESGETEISLTDLKEGDVVRVEGKFSAEGVLASSIEKLTSDADNGFEVRGKITEIQVTDTSVLISLAGITVTADKSMKTSGPGTPVDVASLTVGTAVKIEGTISGTTWNASSVHVLTDKGKRKNVVRFEGTIDSIGETMIYVVVDGTAIPQPVIMTSDTKVLGTLVVGAVVEVKGKLNADLKLEADVITVLGALEIKPDERKIKIGQEATFTVKLRETATSDVAVTLDKLTDPNNAITLSDTTITVPKGSKTADFKVMGQALGEATIRATANGQTATADVVVGEFSDSDNENPNAAVRIVFAPDHIKIGAGETRDVVLLVKPPELNLNPGDVTLEVKGGLESAEIHRDHGNGAARYKVLVKARADSEGQGGSVIATLPKVEGSGTAELVVVITSRGK